MKGDWEFLKLLIGLNSAAFAGWFLAEDRLVTSITTAIAFVIVLAAFGFSAVYTLLTIMKLSELEHAPILSEIRSADGGYIDDPGSAQMFKDYFLSQRRCMFAFVGAFGMAASLILVNLFHKHLPLK
jgi:hypothetical protein